MLSALSVSFWFRQKVATSHLALSVSAETLSVGLYAVRESNESHLGSTPRSTERRWRTISEIKALIAILADRGSIQLELTLWRHQCVDPHHRSGHKIKVILNASPGERDRNCGLFTWGFMREPFNVTLSFCQLDLMMWINAASVSWIISVAAWSMKI